MGVATAMPNYLKAIISALVLAVAATTFHLEQQAGADTIKWVVVALGAIMVFAVWLFPEAQGRKQKGE